MSKRKVVVIGASGLIASLLLPALRERYDLTLLDVKKTDRDGNPVDIDDLQICDMLDKNRDNYRHFFTGADTIINLAFIQPDRSDPDMYFAAELNNVQIAYNIYMVALEEGVRRVVNTSSNHAADYWERLILDGKFDFVDPNGRALSDNYYGWAKETYEHLGFVFACGKIMGKPLDNVQIRIGGPRETDLERLEPGNLLRMRRSLAVYISQRDLSQLYIKSIETEDIRDEFGVPFQIFYGISNNSHAFWSITNARRIIGYEPEDNSELRFAELIAMHIAAAKSQ